MIRACHYAVEIILPDHNDLGRIEVVIVSKTAIIDPIAFDNRTNPAIGSKSVERNADKCVGEVGIRGAGCHLILELCGRRHCRDLGKSY